MSWVLNYDGAYQLTPFAGGMAVWSAISVHNDFKTGGVWAPEMFNSYALYLLSAVNLLTFWIEDFLMTGVWLHFSFTILAYANAIMNGTDYSVWGTYWMVHVPTYVGLLIDCIAILYHYQLRGMNDDLAADDTEDDTAEDNAGYGNYYYN